MDVDVPNACGTITDPSAPMALRLQGNLLWVAITLYDMFNTNALTVTEFLESFLSNVLMS